MAHNLRYYKELQHADGSAVRLEIHEKNGTAPAIEIGSVLQTLRLDIQGGTDTIDAPIVKTSLTMAFVDAPDITDGKCGDWQEFYTPDSTKWKVVVKAKIPGASYVTIWGGYITPDSYSEQLTYRGSVSIIARDNIGHMQDFPFDLAGNTDGMITLRELLDAAWAKIESPMQLDFWHQEQEANYLRCNGIDAIDTYLNVSAFKEMNFCEAVEKALYGYGLVLRYVGRNIVSVMSLRDLPLQGRLQPLTVLPTFLAGAERELAPAARRIEETAKYEFGTGVQALLATSIDFTGAAGTCAFYSTNIFGETTKVNIPVHPIANTNTSNEGWSNLASSTLFFNPNRYVIRDAQLIDDANRLLFLAANTDGSHWVAYRKSIYCSPFRWEMTFGRVVTRQGNDVSYCYGFASGNEDNGIGSIKVKEVICYVSIEQNGSSKYYDGAEWQAEPYKIILQPEENKVSLDLGFKDITGNAMVAITVENIEIDSMRDYSDGSGMYVPIQSLNFVPTDALSLCETNTVNTNYVDTNNVIISRDPEIAPALNEVPFPNVIKNGIFVKSGNAYLPAKEWAWSGGTPQQMAVYNHLQLLCYHAKPNNVITGDIVNTDFVYLERLYRWNGEDHILISGSYNFIDGVIESAVLRSFAWYSDMWSDVTGIDDSLEQNSRTVAEGTGQSSASRSTYNNTATVNIGGGSSGGGSAEVTTLAALNDVNLVNLADGQSLVYDLAQGRWVNQKITVDYTLPIASSSVRGGVKVGFSAKYQNGSYYSIPVELDSEKAFVKLTKTMVSTALGYTPMNQADFTGDNIVLKLGYTPFDSDAFTKSNIKNELGIADWALAASKPSYTWTEIGSRPTALSAFTNDLGLGSLAYKSSLVASDIPSLPWSKITSGKPSTLGGYGITDGLVYSDYINLDSAYRHIGYGYASIGWKTSGPAAVFGTALYNLRMQCAISNTDTPNVYVSQMYNGVAKEWAELVTYEGVAGKDFEALRYKIGETYVLHRSGNDTYVNYGNRATGSLGLYGTSLYFTLNGSSVPFKILADGKVHIAEAPLTKGTSGSLKTGAYEAFQYFSDGKLIMHRNEGATNFYFNYGGAAEPMYLYGSMYGFHIGASRERAFTIDSNKDASFVGELSVAGNSYSKNYPGGKALSQDPTSAFISTIFDDAAVSDSSYRMKILRSGLAYDRFNAAYSPILTIKASDTHGFISFGYNSANKDKCYIGAGIGDAINWSGKLFHDNMDLIPKDDGVFYLGYSDKRWRTLNTVNVSANGLFGYVPNGGTYQQYRVFYEGDKLYIQAGSQDGLSTVGKLVICGIYSATLADFTIYSQQTLFSGAVQVNGTSRFVSLATFDKGLKIGDATLTWDATAGMLKIDKGVYIEGAITAKKKA